MKVLMTIVERAVRPMRACAARKRKIRDELLVHVIAAYEEERAKGDGEDAAIERTALRFGNPVELGAQLQESVPASDCVRRVADRMWSRPGESWWRRALRRGLLIVTLLPVIPLLCWLAAGARLGTAPDAETMRSIAPVLFVVVFSAICFTFLAEWMRHALYGPRGRSWIQIALIVPTCGLLSLLFAFCLWRDSATGWAGVDKVELGIAFGYGLLWIPAGLGALARASDARMRRDCEWATLKIA